MGNNSSSPFIPPVPIEYGPGIIKTFSVSGPPTSYIQIDENNLKTCLQYTNDQNTINQCISNNIYIPSVNGYVSKVNLWNGEQLPPNPSCIFAFNKETTPQKSLIFAGMGPGQIIPENVNNFQNLELSLNNNNYMALLIVVVLILLIIFFNNGRN